eukprot:4261912-Pleurochrysis_carterae.AAC.1
MGDKKKVKDTEFPRNASLETDTTSKRDRIGATRTGEGRGEQISELHIGTLNISGITFGYRGRYIKTEEELLKIRPGDKLREVTEMMKTQG